ncbi:zinc-binding alcohol dehydrogenase family protein [Micromonospora sp. NPDC047557]|uniref:quinone oxidoreductase family protein n=1 Tax=Micromonospora sp. NPDC047557 TaxID=3364250 RepID=UPI0037180C37
MRAVRFTAYGEPAVLTPVELPVPEPGPGQVLVRVAYAGVNFAEVMFRRGQIPVGLPHLPGLEVTGTVERVGADVRGLAAGARVAALTLDGGGYAEYALVRADHAIELDGPLAGLSPVLAAAFPCNVPVAWGVVHAAARVLPTDTVLITAPGGGVGTAAAQLARNAGAGAVYGVTSSTAKAAYAAGFGYDEVWVGAVPAGRTFDVVLDSVGGGLRQRALELLAPFGRYVVLGDAADAGDRSFAGNELWGSGASVGGYNLGALAHRRPDLLGEHLREAAVSVATGAVRIDVTEVPLTDVAKAHELLESRMSTGKYVLRVHD